MSTQIGITQQIEGVEVSVNVRLHPEGGQPSDLVHRLQSKGSYTADEALETALETVRRALPGVLAEADAQLRAELTAHFVTALSPSANLHEKRAGEYYHISASPKPTNDFVIVCAPPGAGKTRYAEQIREVTGSDVVIDGFGPDSPAPKPGEDVLVLTNMRPTEAHAAVWDFCLKHDLVVDEMRFLNFEILLSEAMA